MAGLGDEPRQIFEELSELSMVDIARSEYTFSIGKWRGRLIRPNF